MVPPRAQAAHQQAEMLAKSIASRVEGRPLLTYQYRDLGSIISLSRFSAIGLIKGNIPGSFLVHGCLAKLIYAALYRMHQICVYGHVRAIFHILGGRVGRRASPRLKLH